MTDHANDEALRRLRRRALRRRHDEESAPHIDTRPEETEAKQAAARLAAAGHSVAEVSQVLGSARGEQKAGLLAHLQQGHGNAFVGQVVQRKEESQGGEQQARAGGLDPATLALSIEFFLGSQWAAQSNRREPLHLTPEMIERLREWLPPLSQPVLRTLWDPEPRTPQEALQRLQHAGFIPVTPPETDSERLRRILSAPGALPGGTSTPAGEVTLSLFGAGMAGLHVAINQPPPTPEIAVIVATFRGRGLRLTDPQLKALLSSREQGIRQIAAGLSEILPHELRGRAQDMAEWLADLLLSRSLEAQLQAEEPKDVDRLLLRDEPPPPRDTGVGLSGTLADLARQVPMGASLTIHFQ